MEEGSYRGKLLRQLRAVARGGGLGILRLILLKLFIVTITDGEDNACLREGARYTAEDVKKMVEEQTKTYKWDFAYIGANQDAWAVGRSFGSSNNMNYTADSAGTKRAFLCMTRSATNYRTSAKGTAFSFVDASGTQQP